MGAWGIKAFEDDESSDWVYGLEDSKGFGFIESTFENWFAEAGGSNECLAAAETVAACLGNARSELPEEVIDWVGKAKSPDSQLVGLAVRTVTSVLNESELRELWEESDDYDAWQEYVADLLKRLELPPTSESEKTGGF